MSKDERIYLERIAVALEEKAEIEHPDRGYLDTKTYMERIADAVEQLPSGGITPTGTITITENGTGIDVSQYALADVNVSSLKLLKTTLTVVNSTETDVYFYDLINNTYPAIRGYVISYPEEELHYDMLVDPAWYQGLFEAGTTTTLDLYYLFNANGDYVGFTVYPDVCTVSNLVNFNEGVSNYYQVYDTNEDSSATITVRVK